MWKVSEAFFLFYIPVGNTGSSSSFQETCFKSQTNEDKIGPVTAAETPSDLFVFSILWLRFWKAYILGGDLVGALGIDQTGWRFN